MRMTLALIALSFGLSACVTPSGGHEAYLTRRGVRQPSVEQFSHCRGYGCKNIEQVALNKKQWLKVAKAFRPKAKTAEKERAQIAKAIGIFETEVGRMVGTDVDHYGTFKKMGTHQLDCVDESTNTTIYLMLLKEKGLLRYHALNSPQMRVPIIHSGRWPHQTAVITEIENDERFAVDSWFHDNGAPAEIVALKTWKSGWKPEKM